MITSATTHSEPRLLETRAVYRVDCWNLAPGGAWGLDAFVLTEAADVTEALQWVSENLRTGSKFELYVEVDAEPIRTPGTPRTSHLIRLAGENPNQGVTVPIGVFVPTQQPEQE